MQPVFSSGIIRTLTLCVNAEGRLSGYILPLLDIARLNWYKPRLRSASILGKTALYAANN